MFQLGIDLPEGALINAGLGKKIVLDIEAGMLLVPVTHTFSGESMDVNIAGKLFGKQPDEGKLGFVVK